MVPRQISLTINSVLPNCLYCISQPIPNRYRSIRHGANTESAMVANSARSAIPGNALIVRTKPLPQSLEGDEGGEEYLAGQALWKPVVFKLGQHRTLDLRQVQIEALGH